jgi:hypothetical protein
MARSINSVEIWNSCPLCSFAALLCTPILALTASNVAHAQIYNTTPDWQSADQQVSTGAALVDLNRDGWLDLVIANGNDINRERVVVYYNNGSGQLQSSPGWQSADIGYHGHLDIADVDGDGWTDVAVAVLIAEGGPSAKLYRNVNGTLTSLPVWTSPQSADSFGVAFGDVNGDGRPDLAVASGDSYNLVPYRQSVFLNTGTGLATSPSWQTSDDRNFNNALWLDADRDGDLDLCYTGSNTDTFIYRNAGGSLEATPFWNTTDIRRQFALMATSGDVTGDGVPDLLIADNNQLFAGSGRFRRYFGLGAGYFAGSASWSFSGGFVSSVTLGDLDNDNDLDLVCGTWFGRSRYFLNTGTGFPTLATWTSTGVTSTVEKQVLGDIDRNALRIEEKTFAVTDGRKVVFLPVQPIDRVLSVEVDGTQLNGSQYTFSRENGWVAVGVSPTSSIHVVYVRSRSLDLAVSNWDSSRPNYVYYNKLAAPCAADFNSDGFLDFTDFDAFVSTFETGGLSADFNIDGFIDFTDFDAFVAAFESGC